MFLIFISRSISRNISKEKKEHKIQRGEITYSDLNIPAKPFFSRRYRITGKPDYVVKRKNQFIPVEVKTGSHNKPQKNHILQLAAYCQLIEENTRNFVSHGILVYNTDNQYVIPFDPRLRFELESSIKQMRYSMRTGEIIRNHNEINKCQSCSMREFCSIKII